MLKQARLDVSAFIHICIYIDGKGCAACWRVSYAVLSASFAPCPPRGWWLQAQGRDRPQAPRSKLLCIFGRPLKIPDQFFCHWSQFMRYWNPNQKTKANCSIYFCNPPNNSLYYRAVRDFSVCVLLKQNSCGKTVLETIRIRIWRENIEDHILPDLH